MSSTNLGIRVFLVDDYAPVLWGLSKLIQGEYPRMILVGTACSCDSAITGVIEHRPDVILLDYNLSNVCGLDFISTLAELGNHRILLLIDHEYSRELSRKAAMLGACGVINKESSADLLLSAIECAHQQGSWTKPINPSADRRSAITQHELLK